MAFVQKWDMEDEENVEEELLLVESELDDIQGMITIIILMNHSLHYRFLIHKHLIVDSQ
jgi:hypothetical protein